MPQLQALSNCGFIPLTDSSCSKILRISWVVQYISKSFLKYLFQPFGQHMNRDDQKRIAQLKDYSRTLLNKDPVKEAIWRNLTLQAMKDSSEYGFLTNNGGDLSGKQKHDRDLAREELSQPEMETLLAVLNADTNLIENMKVELNTLIKTAAEIWIDARRNYEPIEASQDVSFSSDSNWDSRYTEFMGMATPYEREAGGNGVTIDNPLDNDLDSVYSRSGDDSSRLVKLCLFPKILRVSQGTPVVIHRGLALFEGGSLIAQGEEEVTEERLREPMPTIDTTTTIDISSNFSNNSGISTAEGSLTDIGSSGGARKLETMIPTPIQEPAVYPEIPELTDEHIKD